MKKNLKIVSAAAAALLAVAPVVATGVNAVNAETINFDSASTSASNTPNVNDHTVNISMDINAIAGRTQAQAKGTIAGTFNASFNGKTVEAGLSAQHPYIYKANANNDPEGGSLANGAADMQADQPYLTILNDVKINLGNLGKSLAGKKITIEGEGVTLKHSSSDPYTKSVTLTVKSDGTLPTISVKSGNFYANDLDNARSVAFIERETGNVVSSGNISLNATNGKVNVANVLARFNAKYIAHQLRDGITVQQMATLTTDSSDIVSQLEKQNIKVDSLGNFDAPKSFTLNFSAKSNDNGATTTMPVTVNVPNGKETTNTDEYAHTTRVWNRKASYIYNASHVRQGNGIMYKIGSGHNVVAENGQPKEYHVGGIVAYKLADGQYKGNYVDVRNFSTSRVNTNVKIVTTRSRVFTNTGKVVGKHNYVNSGVRVKISGTKTIKGHKMYRIATNRYIKAANVRNA